MAVNRKSTRDTNSTEGTFATMRKPPAPIQRKTIGLPETTWAAVEKYQHKNLIPSQAATLRRLLQIGLDAAKVRRRAT